MPDFSQYPDIDIFSAYDYMFPKNSPFCRGNYIFEDQTHSMFGAIQLQPSTFLRYMSIQIVAQ